MSHGFAGRASGFAGCIVPPVFIDDMAAPAPKIDANMRIAVIFFIEVIWLMNIVKATG